MTAFLAPDPIQSTQFIPGGNTPASGGLLFCYQVGSSTKQNTYTDATASTARTNPIVLDSGGNIPGNGEVWIASTSKFVLAPFNDTDPPVSPYWSRDNLPGVNDPSQVQSEWIPSGLSPTFVSGSSFIFSGDQTGTFTPGRRLRTLNTGGTRYSTIGTSVFSASTTIGIASDTIGIDSGLSAVSYGLLNPKNTSLPLIVSVLNFGAKGDGVTDDTTAFAAALATGKSIFLPEGTYLISSSLTVATLGQRIYGEGFLKSIVRRSIDSTFVVFNVTSTSGAEFHNFRIDETSLSNTNTGSFVQVPNGANDVQFSGMWFRYGWQHVLCLEGTGNLTFLGCIFEASRKGAIFGRSSTRNNIVGCTFWKNSADSSNPADRGYAINLTENGGYTFGSDNWNIVGNYFAENVYGPFLLCNTSEGLQIGSNFFEIASQVDNGQKSDIELTSCTYVSITGNTFNSINNSYVAGQRGSKYCVNLVSGNSGISITGNTMQAGVTGTINGTASGVSPIIGNTYSDSTSDSYSAPVTFAQAAIMSAILTCNDRLSALGGSAADVTNSAIRMLNNRVMTWLDSGGGLTNPGFIWYDSSNVLNLGAANNTILSLAAGKATVASGSDLQLGRAYSAGAIVATGTIQIKDSTGTTYNVLVHT